MNNSVYSFESYNPMAYTLRKPAIESGNARISEFILVWMSEDWKWNILEVRDIDIETDAGRFSYGFNFNWKPEVFFQ